MNVFIAGAGNVGGKLVAQIKQQQQFLQDQLNLQVRVVGIANSKKALLSDQGIELDQWQNLLAQAPASGIKDFVQQIRRKTLETVCL